MNEEIKVGVIVKYHPCSAYARGSICPFFKDGSRRCSKQIDQCDMPEYDKWLQNVLLGQIRYFHSPRYIRIFKISDVPLLVYHSLKRKIIGEALITKLTMKENLYYYWFNSFILYSNPVEVKTHKDLQKLAKGSWSFRYITENTLREIRCHAKLPKKVKKELDEKLEKTKKAIGALPHIRKSRFEKADIRGQNIIEEIGLRHHLNSAVIQRAKQIFLEAAEKGLLKGRSTADIATCSIFIALRVAGIPITFKEFSEKYSLNKKQLSNTYRVLLNNLKLNIPLLEAKDLVLKCSQQLFVSDETVKIALSLVDQLKKIAMGKNPKVIAASGFYLACRIKREKTTQKQVAEIFGISAPSIRKYLKFLKTNKGQKFEEK